MSDRHIRHNIESSDLNSDFWSTGFDVDLALESAFGRKSTENSTYVANSTKKTSTSAEYIDVHQLFMHKIDDAAENDISQITELTNSLPKGDHDTAQSLLVRLDSEFSSENASEKHHFNDSNKDFSSENSNLLKDSSQMDVYGRVCYDGSRVVLQLRQFNHDNYPIKMQDCWLCKDRISAGSKAHSHRHVLQGLFQINEEFVQMDIDHYIIPENEIVSANTVTPEKSDEPNVEMNSSRFCDGDFNIDKNNIFSDGDFILNKFEKNNISSTPSLNGSFSFDETSGMCNNVSFHDMNIFPMSNKMEKKSNVNSHSTMEISHIVDDYATREEKTKSDKLKYLKPISINEPIKQNANVLETSSGSPLKWQNYNRSISSEGHLNYTSSNEDRNTFQQIHSSELGLNKEVCEANKFKINQTGAKKRKGKPHKKTSVIQMKENTLVEENFLSVNKNESSLKNMCDVHFLNSMKTTGEASQVNSPAGISEEASEMNSLAGASEEASVMNSPVCFSEENSTEDDEINDQSESVLSNIDKIMINKCRELKCRICGKDFSNNTSSYIIHMKEHGMKDNKLFYCSFCWKTFSQRKNLIQHAFTHTTRKKFSCDICSSSFLNKYKMREHKMNKHDHYKQFACDKCPKTFSRKDFLKNHQDIHLNIKYKCPVCSVECSTHYNLEIHKKQHNKNELYSCDQCSKFYVRMDLLEEHVKTIHSDAKSKLSCSVCDKEFSRKDALKRHLQKHSNLSFNCHLCSKKFSRKDRLNFHLKEHESTKKYQCSKCPAAFNRKEIFKKHESSHECNEQCHFCSKFFSNKFKLKKHLKKHEDQKSKIGDKLHYKCCYCDKTFNKKSLLSQHKETSHKVKKNSEKRKNFVQREKCFQCKICLKSFTRNCNLKNHSSKFHPINESLENNVPNNEQKEFREYYEENNGMRNVSEFKFDSTNNYYFNKSFYPNKSSSNATLLEGRNASAESPINNGNTFLNLPSTSYPPSPQTSTSREEKPSSASESAINLSTEAITAAVYLLAYPSYSGPYQ